MILTQATLPDGLSVWLMPSGMDHRAADARRAYAQREPLQLEAVANAVSDSRRVYEVVPYVSYEGFSKLSGAAAYAATQNVLGTREITIDEYA